MGMRVKAIWADELKPDAHVHQVVRAHRRARRATTSRYKDYL